MHRWAAAILVLLLLLSIAPIAHAQTATAYRWYTLASATATSNQTAAPALIDGDLTTNISIYSPDGQGENQQRYEAAGLIWPTDVQLTSFSFIQGTVNANDDAELMAGLTLQYSTNGTTWATLPGWSWAPAYTYNAATYGLTYTASGPATTVRGIRAIGQVRVGGCQTCSWGWVVRELLFSTATSTPTSTPTATSTPTSTPTATSTPTSTPTATSTPTSTPTATSTPTSTPTATSSATSSATSTPTPTPIDSCPVGFFQFSFAYLPIGYVGSAGPYARDRLYIMSYGYPVTFDGISFDSSYLLLSGRTVSFSVVSGLVTPFRICESDGFPTATSTPTSTPSATATATSTPTSTATSTATGTPTATGTSTLTATPTLIGAATATPTAIPTVVLAMSSLITSTQSLGTQLIGFSAGPDMPYLLILAVIAIGFGFILVIKELIVWWQDR